jgi:hypothetical protein
MDLFEEIVKDGMLLSEALSKSEIKQMEAELAVPEILPCTFDVTIPGWLERIKLWGKVKIKHTDPENHWGKRKVTVAAFLKKISNEELTRMLGKWHIDKTGLTSVEFVRDYVGKKDKLYTEKFLIDVKLKKELR